MEHLGFIFCKSKLKICKLKTYSNYCSNSVNNSHLYLPQYMMSVIFPWAIGCVFFCNLKEKQLGRCFILSRFSLSPAVLGILMGVLGIAARTGRIKTTIGHSESPRAATHCFFWPVLKLSKQIFYSIPKKTWLHSGGKKSTSTTTTKKSLIYEGKITKGLN